MILLPAIDLIGGRCVRLEQGDFERETAYPAVPGEALAGFAGEGAAEAHIVDLDGARAGRPVQHALLAELARATPLRLQVAGGIRAADQVAALLDAGVARVVVGSLAVAQPALFSEMLTRFGADRLTLALDVRVEGGEALVATHGWAARSGRTLEAVLGDFPSVRHLLVTDIATDGMLGGPNLALMTRIAAIYPGIALQASGGVSALDDLDALRASGAARVIVGKAIWEARFTVGQGVARARG
jgi:phosphoribosylformimino-5-aminoimidazole carboxamide ribotide isomerase